MTAMKNEEIVSQAKLYKTRGEWLKAHPATYLLAKRRGVFNAAVAHMPAARRCTKADGARKLEQMYSEAELAAAAAKFTRRSDWDRLDSKTYRAARYAGLLDKLCGHMAKPGSVRKTRDDLGKPMVKRQEYTDAEIAESAKMFSTRKEWREAFPGHYRSAMARGIIDKVAGHQFIADPASYWRVYLYEFINKTAYVGITSNSLHIRHMTHCFRGAVRQHSRRLGLKDVPLPKLIAETTHREAKLVETAWIHRYRNDGWVMLNKKDGGDKGPLTRISTVDWDTFGTNLNAYIVTGAPGSGKTWILRQLTGVHAIDTDRAGKDLSGVLAVATQQPLPIVLDPTIRAVSLRRQFNRVEFKMAVIVEPPETVKQRIEARGGTYTSTVRRRVARAYKLAAKSQCDFSGTSNEVLAWLNAQIHSAKVNGST